MTNRNHSTTMPGPTRRALLATTGATLAAGALLPASVSAQDNSVVESGVDDAIEFLEAEFGVDVTDEQRAAAIESAAEAIAEYPDASDEQILAAVTGAMIGTFQEEAPSEPEDEPDEIPVDPPDESAGEFAPELLLMQSGQPQIRERTRQQIYAMMNGGVRGALVHYEIAPPQQMYYACWGACYGAALWTKLLPSQKLLAACRGSSSGVCRREYTTTLSVTIIAMTAHAATYGCLGGSLKHPEATADHLRYAAEGAGFGGLEGATTYSYVTFEMIWAVVYGSCYGSVEQMIVTVPGSIFALGRGMIVGLLGEAQGGTFFQWWYTPVYAVLSIVNVIDGSGLTPEQLGPLAQSTGEATMATVLGENLTQPEQIETQAETTAESTAANGEGDSQGNGGGEGDSQGDGGGEGDSQGDGGGEGDSQGDGSGEGDSQGTGGGEGDSQGDGGGEGDSQSDGGSQGDPSGTQVE